MLGASVAISILLESLHVPAAALVGPLLVGAAMSLWGARIRYPRWTRSGAQAVTATLVATSLRPDTFDTLLRIWPVALVLLTAVMVCAVLAGVLTGYLARIDREAAIWGFLPGMASAVIAMSADRGLPAGIVAVIQVIRLVTVILMTALLVAMLGAGGSVPAGAPAQGALWLLPLVIALGPLADRFLTAIPAGALLVPLVLASALKLGGITMGLPHIVIVLAYLVIGGNVGLGFDRDLLLQARRAVPVVIVVAIGLHCVGAGLGMVMALVTGVDTLTALLSTVPGSIDAVAAIAYSEGADVSVVMSLQIMRLFVVVLVGPPVARAAARWVLRERG